jgi:hypothetical protein
MELKIVCECGQKYAFDVEPVGGRMPVTVNCPACQADGTATANRQLAEQLRSGPPPPPAIAPSPFAPIGSVAPVMAAAPPPPPPPSPPPPVGGLWINREVHAAPAAAPVANLGGGPPPPPIGAVKPQSTDKKAKPQADGEYSLVRGIIGAVIGSSVGCGLLFAFWMWAHFRFPLMGIAVGAAGGYGARWLARGTDTTLGIITAAIAGVSVTGTFVLMYGGFAAFNIVSIVICTAVAYRASSE